MKTATIKRLKEGKPVMAQILDAPRRYPTYPDNVRKTGMQRHPDGRKRKFTIVDEIIWPQSTAAWKLICFQKIRYEDGIDELRLAYYIIGKRPGMKGKWVWGQYATFLPAYDSYMIHEEAKKRGWYDTVTTLDMIGGEAATRRHPAAAKKAATTRKRTNRRDKFVWQSGDITIEPPQVSSKSEGLTKQSKTAAKKAVKTGNEPT